MKQAETSAGRPAARKGCKSRPQPGLRFESHEDRVTPAFTSTLDGLTADTIGDDASDTFRASVDTSSAADGPRWSTTGSRPGTPGS